MPTFLMVGSPERAVNLAHVKTAKVDLQGVAHLTLVGEGADTFISFRLVSDLPPSSRALAEALCEADGHGTLSSDDFLELYNRKAAQPLPGS